MRKDGIQTRKRKPKSGVAKSKTPTKSEPQGEYFQPSFICVYVTYSPDVQQLYSSLKKAASANTRYITARNGCFLPRTI